jgi:ribosomal protein S18 acetylase RimI-like enzyme
VVIESSMIRAIESNLFSWIPVFGQLGTTFTDQPPGIHWSLTPYQVALFNCVMNARLMSDQVDNVIATVQGKARQLNVPVMWWTSPSNLPQDLETHLKRYGFNHNEGTAGMAVQLDLLDVKLPDLEDFSIVPVLDGSSLNLWSRTLALGFEIPPDKDFVYKGWEKLISVSDPHLVKAYLGLLGGEPVATSLLFLGAGVSGIYSVATIPQARRKGIGARMTLQPLLDARRLGYQTGCLQASDMGVGVYRSLGFQEYCQINRYRWSPG